MKYEKAVGVPHYDNLELQVDRFLAFTEKGAIKPQNGVGETVEYWLVIMWKVKMEMNYVLPWISNFSVWDGIADLCAIAWV